jgi:hypothetical protein
METADHLFVHCRFTTCIWHSIMEWLGIVSGINHDWSNYTLSGWWDMMAGGSSKNRKAIASLTLLVTWEV